MATEQRTTPGQRGALRARYTAEPPTCGECGGPLTVEHGVRFRESPNALVPTTRAHCVNADCDWAFRSGPFNDGDPDVLAAVDDADALAGARAEIGRLRAALATIRQWDCLNPPNIGLCEDFPWLRELVDTALGTGGASE